MPRLRQVPRSELMSEVMSDAVLDDRDDPVVGAVAPDGDVPCNLGRDALARRS